MNAFQPSYYLKAKDKYIEEISKDIIACTFKKLNRNGKIPKQVLKSLDLNESINWNF